MGLLFFQVGTYFANYINKKVKRRYAYGKFDHRNPRTSWSRNAP